VSLRVGLFVPIFYESPEGVIHKRISTTIPHATILTSFFEMVSALRIKALFELFLFVTQGNKKATAESLTLRDTP